MSGRWLRFVLTFATALTAWLVVTPARAAAPLCDHRGAIGFAPAPHLQAPEASIDLGTAPEEDCFAAFGVPHNFDEGRTPAHASSSQASQAMLAHRIAIASASHTTTHAARTALGNARPGAKGRIDRPPRA